MKKLILSFFALTIIAVTARAQNDTLLYENFDVDNTAMWLPFNSGNDTTWVNFDADGLPDANGRPQEWFWSDVGFADVDSLDGCLFSSSWLTNFLPGNRNWLMTPPMTITNAGTMLSWTSAPRQTPRYLDGYSVLVSTTDNIETSFTDTLFQAAQYLAGTGNDFSMYTFSSGFVHGMDGTYMQFDGDSGAFIGEQRPFSASLDNYVGQTIYIAFLHDADDDNLISIDDLLITGPTGLNDIITEEGLSVYPNPARDKVEITYELKRTSPVVVEVYDVKGSMVMNFGRGVQIAGHQVMTIDISSLQSGIYNVVLRMNNQTVETKIVKE